MSKSWILLSLLLFASSSFGQIKIGLMGGPQSASIKETNNITNWDSTTGRYNTSRAAFHFGVTAEIPLGKQSRFYFEPAILYTEKGNKFSKYVKTVSADSIFAYNTKKSLAVKYIDIPLNIAYKWSISRTKTNNIIFSAGPYFSFFTNGVRSVNQDDQVIVHSTVTNITADKTEDVKAGNSDDTYSKFGYGLNARAGFSSARATITAFYSMGLDNLYHSSYSGNFRHKVFGVSLGIWLTSFEKIKNKKYNDKDGDGIPDKLDGCPLQPGEAIKNGCPDDSAAVAADNTGSRTDTTIVPKCNDCPKSDKDNDGIADEEDKCPGVAGSKDNGGCVIDDTNQDGFVDENDKRLEAIDSTNQNIEFLPGTKQDGVIDEKDKHHDTIKNEQGVTDKNILFSTNSAKLFAGSIASLKSLINLLKENPALTLKADGYTDNTGTTKDNMIVAARRARSVKNFLIKNGIDAGRIITNAYGKAAPVSGNQTIKGRAKNRRVEITLH